MMMKGLFIFACLGFVSDKLLAQMPFCLENDKGKQCYYETEEDCERIKQNHEMCIANPDKLTIEKEEKYLRPSGTNLCKSILCLKYTQEHCSIQTLHYDNYLQCDILP